MKLASTIVLFLAAATLGIMAARAAMSPPASPTDPTGMKDINRKIEKDEKGKKDDKADPMNKAPMYSRSAYDVRPLAQTRIDELAKKLTPEDAKVILKKGTEAPGCGTLLDNKKEGTYVCKLCGLPLFGSESKFNSGTGWPSFFKPFDPDHIRYEKDNEFGMVRVEIMCTRCTAHLGHVFEDGPQPTGLRYCLNSASLDFVTKGDELPAASKPLETQSAYFAGGCFWGVEDHLQQVPGVISAVSGYMGGKTKNPTYKDVCTHTTGHAETVKVTFDPKVVSYSTLLSWFFKIHDPTQLNRQGPDVGDSYRSAIFTADAKQAEEAKKFIEAQQKSDRFKGRKIVTQVDDVAKVGQFYSAEDDHQDYHEKHGGSCPLPER